MRPMFPITSGMYAAWGSQKVCHMAWLFCWPFHPHPTRCNHTCQNFPIVMWCFRPAIGFDNALPNLLNKVKNLLNDSIFLWNANLIFMPMFHNKISISSNFETKSFFRNFGLFWALKMGKKGRKIFCLRIGQNWNFII